MGSLFLMDSAKSILPWFLLSSAGGKKKNLFLSLSLFHHQSFLITHVRISPTTIPAGSLTSKANKDKPISSEQMQTAPFSLLLAAFFFF